MKKDIRIMLISGYKLVRCGLRRLLEQEEDMQVVGDYTSAEEALLQMATLAPDIVLIDLYESGMDGIEAALYLKRNAPDCDVDVIILTEYPYYETEAIDAGVASYLLKNVTRAEFTRAIRNVYWSKQSVNEREYFNPEVIDLVTTPPHRPKAG
ncbi:MAG: response regulator transcription factor [Dehalococcoidales bacterium]